MYRNTLIIIICVVSRDLLNFNCSFIVYCTVKNFGSNKFDKKAAAKDWHKKLEQILTCIANRQSSINSKTKPNK